jgi:hypothetical protein
VILFIYLFIYFLFLLLAVPQGTAEPRLGITAVGFKMLTQPTVKLNFAHVLHDQEFLGFCSLVIREFEMNGGQRFICSCMTQLRLLI